MLSTRMGGAFLSRFGSESRECCELHQARTIIHATRGAPNRDCKPGPIDKRVSAALDLDDPLVPAALGSSTGSASFQASRVPRWPRSGSLSLSLTISVGQAGRRRRHKDVDSEHGLGDNALGRIARPGAVGVTPGGAIGTREALSSKSRLRSEFQVNWWRLFSHLTRPPPTPKAAEILIQV